MVEARLNQPSFLTGLSARLLVLTWIFTMLAEFMIYAPSVARHRTDFLERQIDKAQQASLVAEAADGVVDDAIINEALIQAGARAIALRKLNQSVLTMDADLPDRIDKTILIGNYDVLGWITDAFETMAQTENRVLRVLGNSTVNPHMKVEVVMNEAPMRQSMYEYSERIFGLSALISFAVATWVYIGLQFLMVLPIRRITESMVQFRDDPENEETNVEVTDRYDELGVAQRELANMQSQIRAALKQQMRLAALGTAMTKVNHDLRNTLATAMLVADRLAVSEDPDVRMVTPRLLNAMDQAVNLCSQTLEFAREHKVRVIKQPLFVSDVVDETDAGLQPIIPLDPGEERFRVMFDGLEDPEIEADRDQLARVVGNLSRNARDAGANGVQVTVHQVGPNVQIDVADDGPGMPEKARKNLFKPFAGSARKGGTGLGLVIAKDIVEAHGGTLNLTRTGPEGTLFRIEIPLHDPPQDQPETQEAAE
ncbi:MAG: sensor histidine kinase [Magnetospiraceae bacterium]